MLEGDSRGWRSGTRPLLGSPRSQKYRKVRAWISSKIGGSSSAGRVAAGEGAAQAGRAGGLRGAHPSRKAATATAVAVATTVRRPSPRARVVQALGGACRGLVRTGTTRRTGTGGQGP